MFKIPRKFCEGRKIRPVLFLPDMKEESKAEEEAQEEEQEPNENPLPKIELKDE